MLIVLSFSILLSQLPCTISWYLIYYRNILKDLKDHIFIIGLSPIYLFSIRLIEMIYFSLNFFFYITLSPSLRREIKTYISKVDYRFLSYYISDITINSNRIIDIERKSLLDVEKAKRLSASKSAKKPSSASK